MLYWGHGLRFAENLSNTVVYLPLAAQMDSWLLIGIRLTSIMH